ncbi:unnamed protein product [Pedinophyceae sp. YPF-701]|nr:unnamed protein product [Pedinophyceae sp. YPF-701]
MGRCLSVVLVLVLAGVSSALAAGPQALAHGKRQVQLRVDRAAEGRRFIYTWNGQPDDADGTGARMLQDRGSLAPAPQAEDRDPEMLSEDRLPPAPENRTGDPPAVLNATTSNGAGSAAPVVEEPPILRVDDDVASPRPVSSEPVFGFPPDTPSLSPSASLPLEAPDASLAEPAARLDVRPDDVPQGALDMALPTRPASARAAPLVGPEGGAAVAEDTSFDLPMELAQSGGLQIETFDTATGMVMEQRRLARVEQSA